MSRGDTEPNRCDGAPPCEALVFERLEPRILLSADPVSGVVADGLISLGAEVASMPLSDNSLGALSALLGVDDAPPTATTPPTGALSLEFLDLPALEGLLDTVPETRAADTLGDGSTARHELVFVDPRTPDYETLIRGLEANADGGTLDVVVLDEDRDGVSQMSETLAGRSDVAAVHVISHGAEGAVRLGDGWLSADTLEGYAPALQSWRDALGEGADLLLYGCDVAAGPGGEALLEGLRLFTGADVAASTDLTGHGALGGDWLLEQAIGPIETLPLLDTAARESWRGLLATVADEFSSEDYSRQDGSDDWRHDWEERGEPTDPAAGLVRIDTAVDALRIGGDDVDIDGVGILREADLKDATSATLTFDYRRQLLDSAGGNVKLEVSPDHDGGKTLAVYNLNADDGSFRAASFDITPYISDHFQLRFIGSGGDVGSYFFLDNVQITHNGTNSAPVGVADTLTTAEDDPLTITLTDDLLGNDSDADGDTLSVSAFTQPANGTVADNGDGTWTYTPAADFAGPDSFSYTVTDGRGGSDTATVALTVTAVNDAPRASSDSYAIGEDGTLSVAAAGLLDNDTDPDGDSLTVSTVAVSDVRHGTLVIDPDGGFIYTPDADFNGADGFSYSIYDGSGETAKATVDITVSAKADAPTNVSLSNSGVDEGTDTSAGHRVGSLAASDPDAGDKATFAIVGGADAAAFSIVDGNQLILRDGVLEAGDGESYHVVVRATDSSGLTRDQALAIAINPIATPPVESPQALSATAPAPEAQTTEAVEGAESSDSVETEEAAVAVDTWPEGAVVEPDQKTARTPPIESPEKPTVAVAPANVVAGEADVLEFPRASSDPIQRGVANDDPLRRALTAFAPAQARVLATDSTPLHFESPLEAAAFLRELQQVRETVSEGSRLETAVMGSTFAVTTGLSIGYVVWLLRGGVLLTTVLSALPAWAFIDPMPVLGHSRDAARDDDEESLESMVSDTDGGDSLRRQSETDDDRVWSAP